MIIGRERLVLENQLTMMSVMRRWSDDQENRGHVASLTERMVTFRGFHGKVESAQAIMKGYEIFYNFIRKHQAIGVCPYELATDIKLENPNKWLGLIEMAKN